MTSSLAIIQPKPSNLEQHSLLFGSWLASLASPNTLRAYRPNVEAFATWLERSVDLDGTVGIDLLATTRVHVDAYRKVLERPETGTPPVPATVARKLAALSSFYDYALDEGAVKANPVARVKRPTVDTDASTTQGLTREQAQELAKAASADNLRSRALVALLLTSGVRIGEALGADTTDYGHDTGHRVLTVTRKGGKRAKVALAPAAVAALDAYLGTNGADVVIAAGESAPIFTTATGKRWAASEAFRTIKRLAATAGIDGKVSPHSMRHTFATLYLGAGGALHDLQDSMGHADPRTTRRYDRARNNLTRSASYKVAAVLDL